MYSRAISYNFKVNREDRLFFLPCLDDYSNTNNFYELIGSNMMIMLFLFQIFGN